VATNANAINYFSPSRWVVSTVAGQGTHTTITAATSSASSGDTIVLMDYVATEDVAMKTGVNYTAFTNADNEPTSNVTGNWTYSSAGTVSISNIRMTTNSANILTISGSAASIVNLNNCYLNMTNNSGISFSSSSASSVINLKNCNGDLGTTTIAYFTHSGAGALNFQGCKFTNSGSSSTASSVTSSGSLFCINSYFNNEISTASTSSCTILNSTIDSSVSNPLNTFVAGGSGTNIAYNSSFLSGSNPAISVSAAATLSLANSIVKSSNTNAITGTGILNYSGISFTGTSTTINTTTQVGGTLQGSKNTAPSAGFLGEQIRSAVAVGSSVSLTAGTQTNVTSISLTAGIWDVSTICQFQGITTGTQLDSGPNTTSATLGTSGDNSVEDIFPATTVSNKVQTVPAWRVTLSTTTTVYLVARVSYTVGAATAYGRISATRVG
jgi:hypothetical protein